LDRLGLVISEHVMEDIVIPQGRRRTIRHDSPITKSYYSVGKLKCVVHLVEIHHRRDSVRTGY